MNPDRLSRTLAVIVDGLSLGDLQTHSHELQSTLTLFPHQVNATLAVIVDGLSLGDLQTHSHELQSTLTLFPHQVNGVILGCEAKKYCRFFAQFNSFRVERTGNLPRI